MYVAPGCSVMMSPPGAFAAGDVNTICSIAGFGWLVSMTSCNNDQGTSALLLLPGPPPPCTHGVVSFQRAGELPGAQRPGAELVGALE